MYNFLYNCVFCLAFINFLNYWINLFFSSKQSQNFKLSQFQQNRSTIPFNVALFGSSKNFNNLRVPMTVQNIETGNLSYVNEKDDLQQRRGQYSRRNMSTFSLPSVFLRSTYFIGNMVDIFHRKYGGQEAKNKNLLFQMTALDNYQSFSFIIGSILWLAVTLLLFSRIIQSNHFPLANFYEALIFLTWCLVTVNFIILLQPQRSGNEVQKQVSGAILAPCILFIIAFAQFQLSSSITPLVPALKSNWLLMHVSIMICSYTTFLLGGLLSVLLLIQTIFSQSSRPQTSQKSNYNSSELLSKQQAENTDIGIFNALELKMKRFLRRGRFSFGGKWLWPGTNSKSILNGFPSFEYVLEGPSKMQKKNFFIVLDNLSYRMIGIGFPLFTLGILSGAVWANEAWGSYWSWDIKEVGSLINWLIVALYFHCRYKNFISLSHVVAFISLMVLFFNFFGISLGIFGNSLHAYGAAS